MIERDAHVGAVNTSPSYRHQFGVFATNYSLNQLLTRPRRLLHNHPSGDPTPSQADIRMTREIIAAARPLGVVVHDHIIVGRDGHASLKGLQLI